MDFHTFPFPTLFRHHVLDLGPPDEGGWASGLNSPQETLHSGHWGLFANAGADWTVQDRRSRASNGRTPYHR